MIGANGDCPAALVPTVPRARQTQLHRGTVPEAPGQDPGRSLEDDVPRSLSDDLRNHPHGSVRGDVRDGEEDEWEHDLGRNRARRRLSSRGGYEGGSPGNCGRDNPPNDVRYCPQDEGPDDGPDNFADSSVGHPPGGGGEFQKGALAR